MAEQLIFNPQASKADIYEEIMPQISTLIDGEDDLIANLANVCAVLDMAFSHLWTGFYMRKGDQLVLGPFQGPIACTRIPLKPMARGVCGACAEKKETLVVPNVEEFPGHIACSSASKSEIVVPLVIDGKTELVLDIDSASLNTFDEVDQKYLEQIMSLIEKTY